MPAAGGQAVQITRRGGFAAFESQDGKSLYYAKGMDIDGLWSVAVNGGEEAPVLDFPKASFWGYWALVEKGIYFVNTETRPAARSPISELCWETGSPCCRAGQKAGPVCVWDGSVSRRETDSVYPGGPPQQRHHARGKLPLNSAARPWPTRPRDRRHSMGGYGRGLRLSSEGTAVCCCPQLARKIALKIRFASRRVWVRFPPAVLPVSRFMCLRSPGTTKPLGKRRALGPSRSMTCDVPSYDACSSHPRVCGDPS